MSGLGWIDFSSEHRSKVRAVLDLLRKPGVVDELGVGGVRDSISDTLFPGISTIQTRAKYFVLVPRILKDYEQTPVARRRESAAEYLRRRENECISQLVAVHGPDSQTGIMGATLEGTDWELQTKPSAIYWNGIRQFRMINTNLSRSEFMSRLSNHEPSQRSYDRLRTSEDDLPADAVEQPAIDVPYEKDWADSLNIELTAPEAELLRNRMRWHGRGGLLAWILDSDDRADEFAEISTDSFERVLATAMFPRLDTSLQAAVFAARDFWLLIEGAHIRYNLLLQRRYNDGSDELESRWEEWLTTVHADDLRSRWDTEYLWRLAEVTRHKIRRETKAFICGWIDTVLSSSTDTDKMDRLVTKQEFDCKRKRARLRRGGERVSRNWYGIGNMMFRLPQASTIIGDIRRGEGS